MRLFKRKNKTCNIELYLNVLLKMSKNKSIPYHKKLKYIKILNGIIKNLN
jgi:hypothetical protein